jgi:hypothetical protein
LPFLLPRAAQLVSRLPTYFNCTKNGDKIVAKAKSFYFDLALATSPEIRDTSLNHFPHDRLLLDSDMPYAQEGAVVAFNEMLDEYPLGEDSRQKLAVENAEKLFPSLKGLRL